MLRPLVLSLLAAAALSACSTNNSCLPEDGGGTTSGSGSGSAGGFTLAQIGGPVAGPVDSHCYGPGTPDGGLTLTFQDVNRSSCAVPPNPDAGSTGSVYGPTNYNSAADDDDCKYRVSFASTPVVAQQPVTFRFAAALASNGAPVSGMVALPDGGPVEPSCPPLAPRPPQVFFEAFIAPDAGFSGHVNAALASADLPIVESPAGSGIYAIGPAAFFDVPGQWTVRFHFNEECCDGALPDSPHGHAAFFVNVP